MKLLVIEGYLLLYYPRTSTTLYESVIVSLIWNNITHCTWLEFSLKFSRNTQCVKTHAKKVFSAEFLMELFRLNICSYLIKINSNSLNWENISVGKSILNIYFSYELVFNSIEIKNTWQASQPEVFTVRYAFWFRNTRIF